MHGLEKAERYLLFTVYAKKMRYVVQCGAFAERKNAEAMVRQLQEKGFTAIVKSA